MTSCLWPLLNWNNFFKYRSLEKLQDLSLTIHVQAKVTSCVWLFETPWTVYTVHRILQDRILEWVAFPFSWGSSQPRDQTQVSNVAGRFFASWLIREAHLHTSWPPNIYCFPITRLMWMESKILCGPSFYQLKLINCQLWLQHWVSNGEQDHYELWCSQSGLCLLDYTVRIQLPWIDRTDLKKKPYKAYSLAVT